MAEHNRLGHAGEEAAANYLIQHGYTILHRNWRCGKTDIDIVSRKGDEIIFVEVKTRRNTLFGNPEESVNERKTRRIVGAADVYMRCYKIDLQVRYDIITVVGREEPYEINHIEGAFFAPLWN